MSAFGGKADTMRLSAHNCKTEPQLRCRISRAREAPMRKMDAILIATTLVWFVSTSSSAMPFTAQTVMNADWNVENASLVCDEFGRCWQTRSAPYAYPYSGYGYGSAYRPLTKWERKGFCPPGQRKKGNC